MTELADSTVSFARVMRCQCGEQLVLIECCDIWVCPEHDDTYGRTDTGEHIHLEGRCPRLQDRNEIARLRNVIVHAAKRLDADDLPELIALYLRQQLNIGSTA